MKYETDYGEHRKGGGTSLRYFATTCSRLFKAARSRLLVGVICLHLVGAIFNSESLLFLSLVLSTGYGVAVALEPLLRRLKRALASYSASCKTRLSCRLTLTYERNQNERESDECAHKH